jgi:hypothetical protein
MIAPYFIRFEALTMVKVMESQANSCVSLPEIAVISVTVSDVT